jgi:hypothetical protein
MEPVPGLTRDQHVRRHGTPFVEKIAVGALAAHLHEPVRSPTELRGCAGGWGHRQAAGWRREHGVT